MSSRIAGFTFLTLLAAGAQAQDLVCDQEAAVRSLVAEVASLLPSVRPLPRAIAVAGDPTLARLVRSELARSGFEVSKDAADGGAILGLDARAAEDLVQIRCGSPLDLVLECRHGDATWARSPPSGAIVATGSSAVSATRAWEKAMSGIDAEIAGALGVEAGTWHERHAALKRFIGWEDDAAGRIWHATALLEMPAGFPAELHRRAASAAAADRRAVFLRAGWTLGWVMLSFLGFLCADLRSRGYLSGPLKALFGTLMALGVAWIWIAIP